MNNKLAITLFTCSIIANSSVFAMNTDNDEEIPAYVSVQKSVIVKAWKGDKKVTVGGRNYRLKGYIEGICGEVFLINGETDESLLTFGSDSFPPKKGKLKFMDQLFSVKETIDEDPKSPTFGVVIQEQLEALEGIVNIELTQ